MATPLSPVNAPIQGINQVLFPAAVNKKFFKEWVQLTPLYNLMGEEDTRPIVRHKMRPGEGLQYSVGRLSAIDYTRPVLNFDQVRGSGQQMLMDADSVVCRHISFDYELKGRQILELATPIDLPSQVNTQLITACQRYFNKSLLDAAMFDPQSSTNYLAGYNPTTQLPSYDRVAMAGINNGDTATQNATDRTAYYAFANLATAWNSLTTGPAYNQNGLSAKHLLRLKSIAVEGGYRGGSTLVNGIIEGPVQPAFMKTRRGWPLNEYIYFCTTASYIQLLQDPMYYQSTVNRGTVVSADQPESISGATYHGMYEGIHIYELPELSKYISASGDGTIQVAWELFIGAGAWSAGWYEEPTIAYDQDVINRVQEWASHEMRGEKALKFPAKQASAGAIKVEQGIVHSFVRV